MPSIYHIVQRQGPFYLGLCLLLSLSLSSCMTYTNLVSSDPTASISVPGTNYSATGATGYGDRAGFWGSATVRIEKPGCDINYYKINKTDDLAIEGVLLGYYTLGIGFLWGGRYLPSYTFNFHCHPDELSK